MKFFIDSNKMDLVFGEWEKHECGNLSFLLSGTVQPEIGKLISDGVADENDSGGKKNCQPEFFSLIHKDLRRENNFGR